MIHQNWCGSKFYTNRKHAEPPSAAWIQTNEPRYAVLQHGLRTIFLLAWYAWDKYSLRFPTTDMLLLWQLHRVIKETLWKPHVTKVERKVTVNNCFPESGLTAILLITFMTACYSIDYNNSRMKLFLLTGMHIMLNAEMRNL